MIYMSIDASTTCCGWSIFDEDDLIDYGKVTPTDVDAHWRVRIVDIIPQINKIVKKYKPVKVYCEDVPLMAKRGKATLVTLGAMQGALLSLFANWNIPIEFIPVSTWRKDIGLFDGTEKGKERDEMKVKSIRKANELFGIDLALTFTRTGKYNPKKSDDDIADSIMVYCSTRTKYKKKENPLISRYKAKSKRKGG